MKRKNVFPFEQSFPHPSTPFHYFAFVKTFSLIPENTEFAQRGCTPPLLTGTNSVWIVIEHLDSRGFSHSYVILPDVGDLIHRDHLIG